MNQQILRVQFGAISLISNLYGCKTNFLLIFIHVMLKKKKKTSEIHESKVKQAMFYGRQGEQRREAVWHSSEFINTSTHIEFKCLVWFSGSRHSVVGSRTQWNRANLIDLIDVTFSYLAILSRMQVIIKFRSGYAKSFIIFPTLSECIFASKGHAKHYLQDNKNFMRTQDESKRKR